MNEYQEQEARQNGALLSGLHIVNVCVFLLMILCIGGLAILLPKPAESQIEKRELATFPQLSVAHWFSGSFAREIDLFYADTFPGRDGMVSLAANLEELHGIRPDNVRIHEAAQSPTEHTSPTNPSQKEEQSDTQGAPPQETTPIPNNGLTDAGTAGEKLGSVFMYKNMALPIFGGNQTASARYAQTINEYQSLLKDKVQITSLVIPSAIAFYLPEKYKEVSGNQKENIDFIYSKLDPKIKTIDAYTVLDQGKEQYIYFRSDHHWTVRGAYAAYQVFCKAQGFEPVPLGAMERHQVDNFVGTLYNETQDNALKETPDFVEYFVPPGNYTTTRTLRNKPNSPVESSLFADYATGGQNTYSVFLHGDFPLTHVKTEWKTGRKILMVKESFGNAFAPFLVSHYDEVFIVDQRYFQVGLLDFIQKNNITDLLFVNNIFAANTEIRIDEIKRIQNQVYVPYVPKPAPPPPVEPEVRPEVPAPLPPEPEPLPEEETEEKPKFTVRRPQTEGTDEDDLS